MNLAHVCADCHSEGLTKRIPAHDLMLTAETCSSLQQHFSEGLQSVQKQISASLVCSGYGQLSPKGDLVS